MSVLFGRKGDGVEGNLITVPIAVYALETVCTVILRTIAPQYRGLVWSQTGRIDQSLQIAISCIEGTVMSNWLYIFRHLLVPGEQYSI